MPDLRRAPSRLGGTVKRFLALPAGIAHSAAMNTTRRGLAATALPLLMLGAGLRAAAAKSAGPEPVPDDACTPGTPSKRCAAAKARFIADGAGDAAGCPHCAAASKDAR